MDFEIQYFFNTFNTAWEPWVGFWPFLAAGTWPGPNR